MRSSKQRSRAKRRKSVSRTRKGLSKRRCQIMIYSEKKTDEDKER